VQTEIVELGDVGHVVDLHGELLAVGQLALVVQPEDGLGHVAVVRRVPLVVEAVFGGVALLAEHPIGPAVAEKHCLPESVENRKACKPC